MDKKHRSGLVAAAATGLVAIGIWLAVPDSLGGVVAASIPDGPTDPSMGAELVAVSDGRWKSNAKNDTPGSTDRALRITGRVTSDDPTLDFTKVRVAATPSGVMLSLNFDGADRVARPEAYGWVIDTCDADGEFVLEEGLDPGTRYCVTAAGDGSVSPTDFRTTFRPGDDVTLRLDPLFGLEVLFVDELQRTWEWTDHYSPPCSVFPTNRSTERATPSHVAIALLRLPLWFEGEGTRRYYAVNEPGLDLTVYARSGWDTPPLKFQEKLTPVRGGLRRIKKVIPGAGVVHPPVTVVIPDGLLELMLGEEDTLSIHWMLELERQGKFAQFGFRPRFERGKNTWTTTDLPPGTYIARFHVTMNLLAGLSLDPDKPGFHYREEFELGEEGTTLYMPNVPFGTIELTGMGNRLAKQNTVVATRFGGPTSGFVRFDGPPYRIPILWDPEVQPDRPWTVSALTPNGDIDFVGEDGSELIEFRQGGNVRVTLPPAEPARPAGALAR